MARRESCFVGNLREPVPRARVQTVIAPEDAISDERPKLQRDGTLQFNCQVRNTASRIESMRGCNRTSRARFDATLTRSTAIGDWLDPVAIRASSKSPREKTMSQAVHRLASCFCRASRYRLALRDRVPRSARCRRNIFAVRQSREETCRSCRACFR